MIKRVLLLMWLMLIPLFGMSDKELAVTINLAGKQRMLTQKMTKEALLVKMGIDKEKNREKLLKSAKLFNKTLIGLIKGDKELGLVPTDNKDIQKQLIKVERLWKPFLKEILKVVSNKADNKSYEIIEKSNLPLLKEMNRAVFMYASLGKDGINLPIANNINIAGRQRMLTQRMAKDLLFINLGIKSDFYKKDFLNAFKLFEDSLNGLINGDKKNHLVKTTLPKIRNQLLKVKKIWEEGKPILQKAVNEHKDIPKAIALLDKLKVEMNKAVVLYTKSLNRQKQFIKLNRLVSSFMHDKEINRRVVNLAGKQRMLTQRIAKLSLECNLHLRKNSCKDIVKYAKLYNRTLIGFVKGDKELGLPPTKNQKAIKQIAYIVKLWKPFLKSAILLSKSDGKDKKSLQFIIDNNLELLKRSNDLVTIFEKGSFSVNYLDKVRLHIVNIAGRQRMLTQKMTKEKILVTKYNKKGIIESLKGSIKLFDSSLKGLMYGSKELGLIKPDNKEVKKQYKVVENLWKKLKPIYLKEEVNDMEFKEIIDKNPILLKEMDKAVKLSEKVIEY